MLSLFIYLLYSFLILVIHLHQCVCPGVSSFLHRPGRPVGRSQHAATVNHPPTPPPALRVQLLRQSLLKPQRLRFLSTAEDTALSWRERARQRERVREREREREEPAESTLSPIIFLSNTLTVVLQQQHCLSSSSAGFSPLLMILIIIIIVFVPKETHTHANTMLSNIETHLSAFHAHNGVNLSGDSDTFGPVRFYF